jgi:hypothetical protein
MPVGIHIGFQHILHAGQMTLALALRKEEIEDVRIDLEMH